MENKKTCDFCKREIEGHLVLTCGCGMKFCSVYCCKKHHTPREIKLKSI